MTKEIKLKVAEAIQDDVNKGIVRMDSNYMKEVGIRPGDFIEIEGERKTVGIADRSYPGDIGLNIIRLDGILRRNARTGIGESVAIRKTEVKEAKKISIAPARKGILVRASPVLFKRGLLGRSMRRGDLVSIGGANRRKTAMSQSPIGDIFEDLMNNDDFFGMNFGLSDLKFIVVDTNPKNVAVYISDETEIIFNPEAVEVDEEAAQSGLEVAYEDIGGLKEEIKKIREMVELPLKHPELFERLGIEPPKGVLLHGPPGTGKTLLAKAVANETNSHFILINGPEIMSKFYGQSEENIRKKFEEAQKNAPSIIFIDEIDAIASKREETHGEVEKRVVAQLLSLMDGLQSRGKVVVLAATNIPNVLDAALRRPGRFDREIEIGVPDADARYEILRIHTRNMPINTHLHSYDKGLNYKEFKDSFQQIAEKVSADEIIALIPKKGDDRSALLEEVKSKVQEYMNSLIPKSAKTRYFEITKKSLNKVVADVHYLIRENIVIKEGSIEHSPELKKVLEAKAAEMKDARNLDALLSGIVRDIILREMADVTYGYVGADLSALATEAAIMVLRKVLPELRLKEDEAIPKEILDKLYISMNDFRSALKIVRPSALREVLVDVPNVRWNQVGGLESVRQELLEAVEWPLKSPESFRRLGVRPPKGILLYGAPGTGKTLLAKAVANETNANFILVKGPEMLSKWVGESEKAVREVFKKARQTSPTIIFFDEIDAIAPRRGMSQDSHVTERVVNQLLTELDGLEEMNDVVIIAATNRPDMIDTALLRPGRFDRIILTPAPDEVSREEIFKVHTKNMPIKGITPKELAQRTEFYAGADIEAVCREAAIYALRDNMKAEHVRKEHFDKALDKVPPSVTKDISEMYESLRTKFTSARAKEMAREQPNYFG